jgi:uncharacterized protein (TIGR00251 family)
MGDLAIQQLDEAVILTVKVVPGSSKTEIVGILNGMAKIRVSAAPQKGKANKALLDFLAKKLGVKSKDITIITGHKTAVKKLQIAGVQAKRIAQLIEYDNTAETFP